MSNINRSVIEWTKYLVWGFGLVVLFFMVMSEFFQVSRYPSERLLAFKNPIERPILDRLSFMTITNPLGTYELAKRGDSWQLLKPRNLMASGDLVEQIIESLRNLKVRKLYEKDKINLQSFSLHRPTIEINLGAFDLAQKIKVGILNSIDDSTYIVDDKSSLIYQIDLLGVSIQSLGLGDFINSQVFRESIAQVQRIHVKKHLPGHLESKLSIVQKNKRWIGPNERKLNQDRVNELLSKLFAKKVEVILDERSKALENHITKTMGRPSFTVSIEQNDAQETIYKISYPLNSLSDMKLEKKKFVLVTSSENGHPVLADKSILDLLNIRASRLHSVLPKKLFY